MQDDTINIPYKARLLPMVLGIIFFGACAYVTAISAMGDDPNSSRRLRDFSPETARIILWVLTVFCVGFVLGAIYAILRAFTHPGEITITGTDIVAPPRPLSSKTVSIKFADIRNLEVKKISRSQVLIVRHRDGKLALTQQGLPRKMKIADVAETLRQRVISATP